jgi:hypothetical protein
MDHTKANIMAARRIRIVATQMRNVVKIKRRKTISFVISPVSMRPCPFLMIAFI